MDDEWAEREANQFAYALLMPEEFLRADVAKLRHGVTETEVEKLAARYQVSISHMTLRLVQLELIDSSVAQRRTCA